MRRTGTGAVGSMEEVQTHADNFRFHLSYSREDIRVERIRDGKFGHCLIDDLRQLLATLRVSPLPMLG
jgi:hypothetical protein